MSDQVSGDTGRTERQQRIRDAISGAMAKWHPDLLAGAVDDAAREVMFVLAPEPSGVPPEQEVFSDEAMEQIRKGFAESQVLAAIVAAKEEAVRREDWLAAHDLRGAELWFAPERRTKSLSEPPMLVGATTEVERVARATMEEAQLVCGREAIWDTDVEGIVARVVARLSATPKEDAR